MKKLRWPILIAILAIAAIAVLLYTQQQPQPQSPAEPIDEVIIEPESGGIYVEGLVGALGRLNPLLDTYNSVDQDVNRLLYSRLLYFDESGLAHGELADSWGISNDGLIYNFSLRKNAFWHDGEPVTSDDVIFTIEMMRSESSLLPPAQRELWYQVGVERMDDKTLRFILPEPYMPFVENLTFGIVPAHLLGDLTFEEVTNDHFNLAPVGSGPYRFEKLIVEDGKIKGVTLLPFEKYYKTVPYIEQITFRYYPTAEAALKAYQQGETMGIGRVTIDILPQALGEAKLGLHTSLLSGLSLVYLNLDNPSVSFLQDINVRRALMMGINRQWIIDNVLAGQAVQAHGPIFPSSWAYYDGIEHIGYDPNAAVKLLREAGYTIPAIGGEVRASEGVTLTFELLFPDDELHAAMAEAIQEDWAKLGISIDLKALPYDELVGTRLEARDYQAALVDLNLMQSADPDPYPFWHQAQITGGQNYAKWDDRPASEYLELARVTLDQAERIRLYRNFQVRFAQELPALPLYYPVYTYGVDNSVQGVSVGPLYAPSDRLNNLPGWFLLAKKSTTSQQ
ncbi:MAG: ABC transporter substrate-binding protein [Chloroflexota bacterium]